ncbi:type IV pilus biogenesis protein PilM [Granulicella cerasi]|uniref:Type IV pilus biogenesis protein PilM n=1 Tax=Granulicella cerasi TaxID=741063 RepID=A0ABW1ZD02_9BACT|nr:hypothetical protein [Granulicella cerasi]
MNFLPKASGTRPRAACEIAPQGVTAARSESVTAPLAAITSVKLERGAVTPSLKPGNLVDRVAVVAALRKAFDAVGAKPNTRNADVTVVIPDGACRVLLLEFEALPTKLSEALPLVRFRLKKLVPFDADDAMVSFQVLSHTKQLVRVLAVAIPRDVLGEYEGVVREAGFEPGAVLPSTLASLAGLEPGQTSLVVNVSGLSVTTAISREGILLLHRTVDLHAEPVGVPIPPVPVADENLVALPLVSLEDTQEEWAAQQPLPEHGRNPYAQEPAPVQASPYAEPSALADLNAELHNAILQVPPVSVPAVVHEPVVALHESHSAEALPAEAFALEVAQAVNVAAAYYEDTLTAVAETILSVGMLSASALQRVLEAQGVASTDGLRVQELVTADAIGADAVSARVSRGSLAGVRGALRG